MSFAQKKYSPSGKSFLPARIAAQKLACAPDYVGKLCRDGKLDCARVDGAWLVEEGSIAAFEKSRKTAKVARAQELSLLRHEENTLRRNMLSTKHAARMLGCAPDYIGKLCREGKLDGVRVKSAWFVSAESLAQFETERDWLRALRAQELSDLRRSEIAEYQSVDVAEELPARVLQPVRVQTPAPQETPLFRGAAFSFGVVLLFASVLFAADSFSGTGIVGQHVRTAVFGQTPAEQAAALAQLESPFFGVHPTAITFGGETERPSFFARLVAFLFEPAAPTYTAAPQQPGNVPAEPSSTPAVAQTTIHNTTNNYTTNNTNHITNNNNTYNNSSYTIAGAAQDGSLVTKDFFDKSIERIFDVIARSNDGGGITEITDADVPDDITASNYLALSGGTLTGALNNTSSGTSTFSGGLSVNTFAVSSGATSTFGGGIDIASGCFSVNGACVGATTVGGSNGQIQFNNGGTLGGSSNLTFDSSTGLLGFAYAQGTAATTTSFFSTTASSTNLFTSNFSIGSLTGLLQANNGLVTSSSTLSVAYGGTGTSSAPAFGSLLVGNGLGGYDFFATSSLGITPVWGNIGGNLSDQTDLQTALDSKLSLTAWFATTTDVLDEGSTNQYFTTTRARQSISGTDVIAYDNTTGVISTQGGTFGSGSYIFPSNVTVSGNSQLGTVTSGIWNGSAIGSTYGGTGITSVTQSQLLIGVGGNAWTQIGTSSLGVALSDTTGTLSVARGGTGSTTLTGLLVGNGTGSLLTATVSGPLSFSGSTLSISQANSSTNGYLTSADWTIFNNKISSTSIDSSFELADLITDETGSGALVFSTDARLSSTTLLANTLLANATSTTFSAGLLGVGSQYFTSLLGTGLTNSGGSLAVTLASFSTTNLSEGSNLYYTDARVGDYISGSSTIPHIGGTAFGDLLQWSGTAWTRAATSSLGVSLADTTGVLGATRGGTGLSSFVTGDILYADSNSTLTRLPVGASGQVLKVQAGLPSWGVDQTIGGGGSDGIFATSSGKIYPLDTASVVLVGTDATSTLNSIFEVSGQQYISTRLAIATATPSVGAALAVGGSGYVTGGLGVGVLNTNAGTLQTSGNAIVGGSLTLGSALGVQYGGTGSTTLTGLLVGNGTGSLLSATVSGPLAFSGSTLSISQANSSTNGYLSSTDWTLFNNKVSSSSLAQIFPFTPTTWGNSTSTLIGFNNGILVNAASSTITGALNITGAITSTATAANTLPYASTTAFTTSGTGYFGNIINNGLSANQLVYTNNSKQQVSVATSTPALSSAFGYSGTLGFFVGGASGTLSLATNGVALTNVAQIAANSVLVNNTSATGNVTAIATSSFFGTGTGGQVLTWNAGQPQWVATNTYSGSNGITTSFANNTLTVTGVNAAADGATKGVAAFTAADFDASSGVISLDYTNGQAASASNKGFLTSADWSTFNNKISSSSLSGGAGISYNSTTGVISATNAFPFTPTTFGSTNANATSTLIGFSQGIYALASSTIGGGTQTTGLTISGGATTTGNAYFGGTGRFGSTLTLSGVLSCSGGQALQTNASGDISCGSISISGASTGGGWTTNNLGSITLATTSDRVGIGATSTPYAKLSILSGATGTTTLALLPFAGQTANILDIYNTSGVLSSVFTASGRLGLGTTSPSQVLSVEGGASIFGNVGIGTTSPYSKLSVVGGNITQIAAGAPTLATSTPTGDVTYLTYVAGNYAYVADNGGGLKILDVTNPKKPTVAGVYSGVSTVRSVVVAGKYAYVADSDTGLNILDVSNPASPTLVGVYADSGRAFTIALSGRYVFLPDVLTGTLRIVDVANPANPTLVGSYVTNASGEPYAVAVSGKYAYVGDQVTSRIYVLDISNPTNPTLVSSYATGVVAPTNIYLSGKYAYVSDAGGGFYILNVSNPASLSLVGSYSTSASYYAVQVAGGYAYVADNVSGTVVVLDVSSVSAPTLVGTYSGATAPRGIFIAGKYVYVADLSGGLKTLDVNGIEAPTASIGAIQTNILNVTDSASVGGDIYAGGGLNVGLSGIFSRGGLASFGSSTLATTTVSTLNLTGLSGTLHAVNGRVSATSTLSVGFGGTGSTTLTGLLVGNGTGSLLSATVSGPLAFSGSTLSIAQANSSTNGYLSSADWTTFNNKISSSSLAQIFPFTPTTNYGAAANSTSTPIWFTNGIMASSTSRFVYASTTALTVVSNAYFPGSGIWNSSGNVGIGTTSPLVKLNVAGTQNQFAITDSDSTGTTLTGGTLFSSVDGFFNISGFSHGGSGSAIKFTLDQITGNVGIGTTTPGEKLSVYGGDFSVQYGQSIRARSNTDGAWTSGTTKLFETGWNGATDFVSYYTPGSIRSTPVMTALATGNVGIGTTSPGQKLSVAGDILGNNIIGSYFTGTSTTASTFAGAITSTATSKNTFPYASTTALTVSGSAYLPSITGSLLATDANGKVIATTTVGAGVITGTLGVANGGTGSTTLSGILVGNGTSAIQTLTVSSPLTFSGSTLAIQNAAADGTTKGAAAFTAADFDATSGLISIDYTNGQAASASTKGFLTSADWTIFNNKISSSSLSQIFPFTPVSYGNATSTTIGFTNGILATASSTFTANTYFPGGIWNSSGNVGIGETSPWATLTIASTSAGAKTYPLVLANKSSTAGAEVALRLAPSGNPDIRYNEISAVNTNGTNSIDTIFTTAFGGTITEKMRITSTGNVGIGTTSPGQKLSVAGDILGNNVIGSYFTGTSTATSTLSGGLSTTRLNVTSGTSTFANGTNLTAGCYAIGGTCLSLSTISGTLGVANGGTGSTTLSGILVGNGTSAIQTLTVSSPLTFSGSTLAIQNAAADGSTKGAASFTATDFDATSGNISIDYTNGQAASGSNKGFLTSADWTLFNNKISSSSLAQIFPFTTTGYGVSTSTTVGFTNGLLATASSTFTSSVYFPGSGIWNSTGNVGIGTTTPLSLLNVAGATAPKITISDTNASADQKHWFVESSSGVFSVGTTSDALATNATYRAFAIDAAGDVGIGTVAPSAKLQVEEGATADATFGIYNSSSGNGYLSMTANLSAGAYNGLVAAGNKAIIFTGGSQNTGDLVIGPWSSSSYGIKMLGATGLIGVNKATPTYNFDVTGNARFTSLVDASNFVATSTTATSTFAAAITVGAGQGTSTFAGGLSTTRLNVTSGTSTFANGTNLTAGCYAIGGTCLSLSTISGTLGVANGGTGSTTLSGILVGNGTSAIQTLTVSSPLTFSGSTLAIQNAAADGTTKGAASFTAADFDATSGLISIDYTNGQAASASNKGFLTSADWTVFNNKISSSSLAQIFPFTPVSYGNSTSTTIGFTNGLLATASSTFTSNTYFPGSGIWNSSGLVGIGTTSPLGQGLNVSGTQNQLVITDSDSTGTTLTGGTLLSSASGFFNISGVSHAGVGSAVKFTLDQTTGNVGIGTTTPNSLLTLQAVNGSAVLRVNATNASGDAKISLNDSGGNEYTIGRDTTTGFLDFSGTQTTFSGYKWRVNSGTEVMRITNGGNVGIGTTTPGQKLSVAGDILGNNIIGSYFTSTSTTASTFAGAITSTATSKNTFPYASSTALSVSGTGYFGTANVSGLTASRLVATDGSKNLASTITLANLASSISDVTGTTGTGNLVLSASPTFTGTANFASAIIANSISAGTVSSGIWNGSAIGGTYGGTGLTSVTQNSLLIGGAGNTWTQVATSSLGIALADTVGTLTVAKGGTGATTLTGLLIGNGTSAFTATTLSSGISGQLSDETGSGSLVFSAAPTFTGIPVFSGGARIDGSVALGGSFSSSTIGTDQGFSAEFISVSSTSVPYMDWKNWASEDYDFRFQFDPANNGFEFHSSSTNNVLTINPSKITAPYASTTALTVSGNAYFPGSGIWNSSGNVGIGTTSPGQKLSVAGDILGNNIIGSYFTGTSTTASTLAGGLTVGGAAMLSSTLTVSGKTRLASTTIDEDVSVASGNTVLLTVSGDQTAASTGGHYGASIAPRYTAAAGSTLTALVGAQINPVNTSTGDVTSLYGVYALGQNSGGGTVGTMRGVWAAPANSAGTTTSLFGLQSTPSTSGAATTTTQYGLYTNSQLTGSGAVTTNYGVYADPAAGAAGSGTITNQYGLYVRGGNFSSAGGVLSNYYQMYLANPLTTGTITNPVYGIYQQYTSALNYFGGNVGLNVTSPDRVLTVAATTTDATYGNQLTLQSASAAIDPGELIGGIDFRSNDNNITAPGIVTASLRAVSNIAQNASQLGTDLVFSGTTGTTFAELMRLTGAGNLGVGTTSPGSLLSLGGIANFTTATSTFYGTGGLNLAGGCYAVNGTCLTVSSFGGTLAIANGGTNATTQTTNGVNYFNGTSITSGTDFNYNGTNVGIGSTSPSKKLTVLGSSVSSAIGQAPVRIGVTTASSVGLELGTYGGGFAMLQGLQHTTNSAGMVLLNPFGGSVGVGTTTSSNYTFSVTGTNYVTGATTLGSTLSVSGAATLSSTLGISGAITSTATAANTFPYASTTALTVSGDAYFDNGTGIWNSSGSVGIGTTNPASKLEVSGGNIEVSGSVSPSIIFDATSGSDYVFGSNTALPGAGIYDSTATAWRLVVRDTTGNVGIGTTSPGQKLSVAGDILGNNIIGSYFTSTSTTASTFAGAITSTATSKNTFPYASTTALTVSGNAYFPGSGIWNSSGLVGIGTTSPLGQGLNVSGTQNQLVITDSDSTGTTLTGGTLLSSASGFFNISGVSHAGVGSAVKFTLDQTTGNVGIGTSTPNSLLTLQAANGSAVLRINATNASGDAKISLNDSGGNEYTIGRDTTTGFLDFSGTQTTFSGYKWRVNSGTEVMRITNGGNVGIGTTTPGEKLSVYGGDLGIQYGQAIRARANTDGLWTSGTTKLIETTFTGGLDTVSIFTPGSQRATEVLTLKSTGNVGIGTTTPGQKLSVAGDILGNNVIGSYFTGTSTAISTFAGVITSTATAANTFPYASTTALTVSGNAYFPGSGIWNSSGNVGIGTTTPVSILNIANATNPKITITDTDAASNQKHWFVENSNGEFNIGTTSDALVTGTGRAFTIEASGEVGIGTVNPTAVLEIAGGAIDAGNLFDVSGAYTATASLVSNIIDFSPTLNLGFTGTTQNIRVNPTINLTADMTSFVDFNTSPTLSTGSNIITTMRLNNAATTLGASFTGSITSLQSYRVGDITNAGAGKVVSQAGLTIEPLAGAYNNTMILLGNANLQAGNYGILSMTTYPNVFQASTTEMNVAPLVLRSQRAAIVAGSSLGNLLFASNDTQLLASTTINVAGVGAVAAGTHSAQNQQTDLIFTTTATGGTATNTEKVRITGAGFLGIGTTSPNAMLTVGSAAAGGNVRVGNGWLCVDNNDTCTGATTAGTVYAVGAYTTGADLAEQYPTLDDTLVPGEIVSFDVYNNIHVVRAAGEASFLGVISTAPGVLLNGYKGDVGLGSSTVPVALAGRVPVKVSLEGGAIAIGDRLMLSSTPGVAKKATESGQTIGVALEPYTASATSNTVLVFIDPQYTFAQDVLEVLHDIAAASEATSTDTSGDDATTTSATSTTQVFTSIILQALAQLGVTLENGIARFMDIFADHITTNTLTVGSTERPAGITLFDKVTGEPYCLEVVDGDARTTPGECVVGGDAPAPDPAPEPTPTPEPVADDAGTASDTDSASSTPATSDDTSAGSGSVPVDEGTVVDETAPADTSADAPTGDTAGSAETSTTDTSATDTSASAGATDSSSSASTDSSTTAGTGDTGSTSDASSADSSTSASDSSASTDSSSSSTESSSGSDSSAGSSSDSSSGSADSSGSSSSDSSGSSTASE